MATSSETAMVGQALTKGAAADAAWALSIIRSTSACGYEDALAAAAARDEGELASMALDLLAQSSDTRALPLIEAAVASGDPARMAVAASWLPHYGDAGLDVASRLLGHKHAAVRAATIVTLGQFTASPKRHRLLSQATQHADRYTAVKAARVLKRLAQTASATRTRAR